MRHVLITGMSAVGKSSVIEVLRQRGHAAVDLDTPEWSHYSRMDEAEADELEWLWREGRLSDLLSSDEKGLLFVSGCARNQGKFYARFDRIILLTASETVTRIRLATRTSNEFGKGVGEASKVLSDKRTFEQRLRPGADVVINTDSLPLNSVAERVLETVGCAS